MDAGRSRPEGDLPPRGSCPDCRCFAGGGKEQLTTIPLALAAAVSAAAALAAWLARTLTAGGAAAAWSVGLAVLYGTGWQGGAVLAAFFVSSNLISRIPYPHTPSSWDPKGDRRDHRQVYANGGAAALAGAVGLADTALGLWLLTASLAAAAADTWATAVGSRSRVSPRLIWSRRVVPAGTNGGMTFAGTLGSIGGASLVAAIGAVVSGMPILLPLGTLIGFIGMMADSALGELLQGRFRCTACNTPSEWKVHRCGAATVRESGIAWLNNDGVNFLATSGAAGMAWAAWHWLPPI